MLYKLGYRDRQSHCVLRTARRPQSSYMMDNHTNVEAITHSTLDQSSRLTTVRWLITRTTARRTFGSPSQPSQLGRPVQTHDHTEPPCASRSCSGEIAHSRLRRMSVPSHIIIVSQRKVFVNCGWSYLHTSGCSAYRSVSSETGCSWRCLA